MNPDLIIVPEKYEGHEDTGFDIALIGFEESDLKILDEYYDSLKNIKIKNLSFSKIKSCIYFNKNVKKRIQ